MGSLVVKTIGSFGEKTTVHDNNIFSGIQIIQKPEKYFLWITG